MGHSGESHFSGSDFSLFLPTSPRQPTGLERHYAGFGRQARGAHGGAICGDGTQRGAVVFVPKVMPVWTVSPSWALAVVKVNRKVSPSGPSGPTTALLEYVVALFGRQF